MISRARTLLIRAGAQVNAANDLGATPLWLASLNGSASDGTAAAARLARIRMPPCWLARRPLMVASRSGNADVVEQLLAKGANVNARAARGQTALMWAVAQKHPDVVKVLLAHVVPTSMPARTSGAGDGRAAARSARIQPRDSARRRHGADVCGARGRSRLGEAARRRRRRTSTTPMPGA